MTDIYPLLIAVLLGTAIGLERKINDHSVGIHTHALVALGAALFILLGIKISAPGETGRVAAQVVMGVGFLGGAVIMRQGNHVRGVNTAVTVWCSSAIGGIAGSGQFALAAAGTTLVVAVNFLLHILEHRMGLFGRGQEDPPKNERK